MITRERLEELIKQGATIYFTDLGEITLGKDYSIGTVYGVPCLMQKYYNDEFDEYFAGGIELIDLYETKEEAEFALRYQNITRTETLSLPTWEEINKLLQDNKSFNKTFYRKDEEYDLHIGSWTALITTRTRCCLYTEGTFDCCCREDYYKICEFCRKLFLGEEVE